LRHDQRSNYRVRLPIILLIIVLWEVSHSLDLPGRVRLLKQRKPWTSPSYAEGPSQSNSREEACQELLHLADTLEAIEAWRLLKIAIKEEDQLAALAQTWSLKATETGAILSRRGSAERGWQMRGGWGPDLERIINHWGREEMTKIVSQMMSGETLAPPSLKSSKVT
jgi:hypothetical protein